MKILAIETSCDETAVAILEAAGDLENPVFTVLGNTLYSQASKHAKYGGVYPTLAKREHAKNLTPLLKQTLVKSNLLNISREPLSKKKEESIQQTLAREPELFEQLIDLITTIEIPDIDVIAVTQGPGLAPALWVGLNFAKSLSIAWDKPLIPINHMEGHILSPLITKDVEIKFPAISLLISGGHTQLVHMSDWFEYTILGETKDDAVGEAFDKVARMLGIPYPGGPEISKLAEQAREKGIETETKLPRPMQHSGDLHFSFSGLKTAVLYRIKDRTLSDTEKMEIAREFEDAVVDILIKKTKDALEQTNSQTLILGGGVTANTEIRNHIQILANEMGIKLLLPEQKMATDNAIMIGIAGYLRLVSENTKKEGRPQLCATDLRADGNLRLG